jgi:hypothetical protein
MRRQRRLIQSATLLAVLALGNSGCADKSRVEQTGPERVDAVSKHPNLQWKRYSALEADLVQALELPADELCNEFGVASCVHTVHLASLGGNEPFKSGLLEPSAEPLATTPAVVDRLLLSACGRRTELDRAAGPSQAKVFRSLDLAGAAPAPEAEATKQTITELYHRLLAREPEAPELVAVASLVKKDAAAVTASEFATLACFSIGTSTEFLFF